MLDGQPRDDLTHDTHFFPLIMTLDFGLTGEETAIWFGILTLIVVEVGLSHHRSVSTFLLSIKWRVTFPYRRRLKVCFRFLQAISFGYRYFFYFRR